MADLALVTGSAKRLGRTMALRLAHMGCDVAIHYHSDALEAETTRALIGQAGVRGAAFQFDLRDETEIQTNFDAIRKAFGRTPTILVNSASIFEWDDISTVSKETLGRHFDVNLWSSVLLTKALVNASSEDTRGVIVNILDQKLFNPNGDHLSYTLTKYALMGFTRVMAKTLAPKFRVCGIAPGYVLPSPTDDAESFEALHDKTPLGRGPTPDDVASALAFIVSNKAVTDQIMTVDAGSHMAPATRDFSFLKPEADGR